MSSGRYLTAIKNESLADGFESKIAVIGEKAIPEQQWDFASWYVLLKDLMSKF